MPARAHHAQGCSQDQNPPDAPGAIRNSSLVAAAAPKCVPPLDTTAEPVTTTSLRYLPDLALSGTTSSSGTRACWCGDNCIGVPETRIQDGGTALRLLDPRRSTFTVIDSPWEPVLATCNVGSA